MFICLSAPGFLTRADKKKHAYGGLPHGEIYASPGKSLRPSTRNPAFPRALVKLQSKSLYNELSQKEIPVYIYLYIFMFCRRPSQRSPALAGPSSPSTATNQPNLTQHHNQRSKSSGILLYLFVLIVTLCKFVLIFNILQRLRGRLMARNGGKC